MFHTYIFLVGACLPFVSASVYPTQPIQATVWSADQPMLVSWIEDWKYPMLTEMGPLDISLWSNTDTYLTQLASGVDPKTKTCQVTVPGWVLKQGSKYTLRFTMSKPIDAMVYSADFAIIPANTTTGTGTGSGAVALATQSGTAGTGNGSGSGFGTVPTTTGSLTSLTATTTTTSASDRLGSTASSGVPPPSGTITGGGVPSQGQRAASAGRKSVDVEKLKFRFVFVIWPVLMGITMAL
ncbi:hypothetical protein HD554DRAFT_1134234 [Boletus coccyginus]|nr:hypothetical protein HD554DRAFT_1134234 [Boletus coccyginus]